MQLEKKSDFDLEVILHSAINGHDVKKTNAVNRIYVIAIGKDQYDVVNVPRYCNDANATIPLAFENKISIRWLDGVNCWVADQQFDNQSGVYSSFSTYQLETGGELFHQSELRTVVICLIKVLLKKPSHQWV